MLFPEQSEHPFSRVKLSPRQVFRSLLKPPLAPQQCLRPAAALVPRPVNGVSIGEANFCSIRQEPSFAKATAGKRAKYGIF